jgi:DNA-binding response OmpR family regulator
MPRILTVDDSRAIRMIVSKQVAELGFEVEEAEDGNDGLKHLQSSRFDLVLLDVTMPNLDGPGMLTAMRERGDKTPVVMLTSESKTSIVAALMKMGISDYILKPFKPDALKAKLLKALKLPPDYTAPVGDGGSKPDTAAPSPSSPSPAIQGAALSASSKVDLLVIDDIENVHKKLRSMIPSTLTVDGCLNATEGLALTRVRKYKLILIDSEIPDTNVASLLQQMKLLQPETVFLALALRSSNNLLKEMRALGFNEVLTKPFSADEVDEMIDQHFAGNQELVIVQENLIRMTAFHGKLDRLDRHYSRMGDAVRSAVQKLGEACFDEAIVDATLLPVSQGMETQLFILKMLEMSGQIGVSIRLVASAEVARALKGFQETKDVRCHISLDEARALAAA